MPPKPPTRTGTGWGAGWAVRPASESVTLRSRRSARRPASCRASLVPPSMRICRMSSASPVAAHTAAPRRWLSIVGIGEDGVEGLAPVARGLIADAEVVFGGKRHLALAGTLIRGTMWPWPSPFDEAVGKVVERRGRPVCVLASGDPFFYGVGSLLARQVDPNEMLVVPGPSSFSLAAARLGWSLPDTTLLSLHGRPLDLIRPHLHPGARIMALTSDGAGPSALATLLSDSGFGSSRLTVMEALGGAHEQVRTTQASGFDL